MARLGFATGRLEMRGMREFLATLDQLGLNLDIAGREALLSVGAHLENKLKRKLSRPATGRLYRTGRKGRRYKYHRASAPGMPPAIDTGRLRASITHNVTGKAGSKLPDPGGGRGTVRAYVGTNVEYGYFLERGTSRIRPRPWFYITVQQQMPSVMRIVQRSLQDYLRRNASR